MKKTLLALAALAVSASPLLAQEWTPVKMTLAAPQAESPKFDWSSDLVFRYDAIGGDDGAGGKWTDEFKGGAGFRFAGGFEYHLNPHWSIGGYVSVGFEDFGGKSDESTGIRITLDDLRVVPVTVGFKARAAYGRGFYDDVYVGVGFASYSGVDAHALGTSVPLFDPSTVFAFEIGTRFGWKVSPLVGLEIGVGYEQWGAPKVDPLIGGTAKPIGNVTVDLGVWLRF